MHGNYNKGLFPMTGKNTWIENVEIIEGFMRTINKCQLHTHYHLLNEFANAVLILQFLLSHDFLHSAATAQNSCLHPSDSYKKYPLMLALVVHKLAFQWRLLLGHPPIPKSMLSVQWAPDSRAVAGNMSWQPCLRHSLPIVMQEV